MWCQIRVYLNMAYNVNYYHGYFRISNPVIVSMDRLINLIPFQIFWDNFLWRSQNNYLETRDMNKELIMQWDVNSIHESLFQTPHFQILIHPYRQLSACSWSSSTMWFNRATPYSVSAKIDEHRPDRAEHDRYDNMSRSLFVSITGQPEQVSHNIYSQPLVSWRTFSTDLNLFPLIADQ